MPRLTSSATQGVDDPGLVHGSPHCRDRRGTYLVLAAVLAAVTIPAHLFGLRGHWPEPDHSEPAASGHVDRDPGRIARSGPFLLLVTAVTLGTFSAFAVVVNQVPLLVERGLSTSTAAWALALGGLGQVLGRLGAAGSTLCSACGPAAS